MCGNNLFRHSSDNPLITAGNDTDIEELLSKSAHLFWKNTAQNGRRVFDYKFDNSYAPPPYYLLPNNSCSG